MKYSLPPRELNGWKARIAERIVEHYIRNDVIPRLKEEGWSGAIYTEGWFYPFNMVEDEEAKFFVANNLYPISSFLKRFEELTRLLENFPDGFLIKLRETGGFKLLGDALKELGLLRREKSCSWDVGEHNRFSSLLHAMDERLPVVDGEVEVIEVKFGRSRLAPNQMRSYYGIIQEGYVFRLFHVGIVSLAGNEFEIRERIFSKSE